jgi:hypothetical protein
MSNQPPSPECLREARQFFLGKYGHEFLENIISKRPAISPAPDVHTFAFSAGRPAGYDLALSNIQDLLVQEKKEKGPKVDSIND